MTTKSKLADSLSESLLKAKNGGAVAVWASTAQSDPSAQSMMNQVFYRELFGAEGLRLGEAVSRAKSAVTDRDVRRTWILFGDPAMRLK
ncbi:MAG TPA: C25 family cysteine peptidase [Blastocatellia bacterium]|nr:C25 family cysteine peptidase [Blastocatellia bacterium]